MIEYFPQNFGVYLCRVKLLNSAADMKNRKSVAIFFIDDSVIKHGKERRYQKTGYNN